MDKKKITLYGSNEIDFKHNGIGILSNCISAVVKREFNGQWTLELEYPLFDSKNLYLELTEQRIIKVPTPSGEQLFRITKTEKGLSTIYIYANHIYYDLADNFIVDTNVVGKSRVESVQQLLNNTMNSHRFIVTGDSTTFKANSRIVRKNPLQAMLSEDDNSIINRWGGEIDFDNFNVIAKDGIGVDSGYLISYGKNLTGMKETLDMSTVATRIVPQAAEGLLLPEYYIDSPLVGNYYQPIIRHMNFEGIRVNNNADEGTIVTEEEALQQLRDVVGKLYFEKHIDQPFFNYEIEFMHLGDTEEYKQFKYLYKLNLGDKVKIRHKKLNLDLSGRIIAYIYDCLTKRYIKVQLGRIKKDINMVINQAIAEVQFVKEKIELQVKSLDEKLSAKIEITEDGILQEVKNTKESLESQITQTANSINLSVDDKISGVNSNIEQTANAIRQEITDTKQGLELEIVETASGINTTIQDTKQGLETKINETAAGITQSVNDKTNNLQSQINVQAGQIAQKVENSTFQSYQSQTASEIASKVSNLSFNSYVTQTASQIASKITSGDALSLIQQNPTDVQYWFNQISPKVIVSQNGLVVMDPAGNITMNNGVITASKLIADTAIVQGGSIYLRQPTAFPTGAVDLYFQSTDLAGVVKDTGKLAYTGGAFAFDHAMFSPAISCNALTVNGQPFDPMNVVARFG